MQVAGQTGNPLRFARAVIETNGVAALWEGISCSLLRQATYGTTRFALFEALKTEKHGGEC